MAQSKEWIYPFIAWWFSIVIVDFPIENGPVEIVDLPTKKGGFPVRYVNIYRVCWDPPKIRPVLPLQALAAVCQAHSAGVTWQCGERCIFWLPTRAGKVEVPTSPGAFRRWFEPSWWPLWIQWNETRTGGDPVVVMMDSNALISTIHMMDNYDG
jgi:hypothetical protein